MMEKEQYEPWQQASIGYVYAAADGLRERTRSGPSDPKHTPYRDCMKNMLPNGYAGTMGYASAAAWPTSSWSTWSPRRRPARRRRRKRRSGRRSGPSATTRSDVASPRDDGLRGLAVVRDGRPRAFGKRQPARSPPAHPSAIGGCARSGPAVRPLHARASVSPMPSRNPRFARSTTATSSGCCSCCPRRCCCCCSSPIRSGWASGSASPTPRSAAPGEWIGLENFEYLWGDAVTRLALFNTLFYTVVASVIKFALGLWLALLLNKHLPFKSFVRADRAAALHRAHGALRDRVLVDLRLAVLDHQLGAR